MYLITLSFTDRRAAAPAHMAAHNDWLARGFADGIFLAAGSIRPAEGGAILAHGPGMDEIAALVAQDPFVAEGIVTPKITDIDLKRTDPRLAFLKDA